MNSLFGDEGRVREYFDDKAARYADGYDRPGPVGHSFRIRKQRVLEMIDRWLPDVERPAVLDVGCGPGIMMDELLARSFARIHAIDVSSEMVAECANRYAGEPRVKAAIGDITRLDHEAGSFDLVLAMGVLEYLDVNRLERAYAEMRRVLKPDGRVILTYPNRISPYRRLNLRLPLAVAKRWVNSLAGHRLPRLVRHREFTVRGVARDLARHRFGQPDVVYYNFRLVPYPLDSRLKRQTAAIAASLEPHGRGRLGPLGTGFIIDAPAIDDPGDGTRVIDE